MSEKTEEATPKKKRDARKKGQVAKSAEFTGMAVMLAAIAVMVAMGWLIAERLAAFMLQSIELATRQALSPAQLGPFLYDAILALALMMGPLIGVTFVFAAFITYLQVGPLLSIKPLIPDFNRLNMAQGIKRLVEPAKLFELAKNVTKLSLMSAVGFLVLRQLMPAMALTPRGNLLDATLALAKAAFQLALFLVAGLVVFGVIDLVWQRFQHAKKLRMSKDDIKREFKQSEGDPMLKGKRKQFHRELIEGAGIKQVQDADAVVVNPTHVAVALRYRESEMRAPTIMARGKGVTAQKIKRVARRHGVPLVRDIALARGLVEVDLNAEIPEEFFEAVAEILRYIYELDAASP